MTEDVKLAREVIEENRYYQEIFKTFPKEKQIEIMTMQRDMLRLVANSISKSIKGLKEDK